jgi:acyl carrier protein
MLDLEIVLKDLFMEIFELEEEDYSDELSYADTPEWDSLGHMEMVRGLTQKLGVEFDIEEVMAMETVAHIKKIVATKL